MWNSSRCIKLCARQEAGLLIYDEQTMRQKLHELMAQHESEVLELTLSLFVAFKSIVVNP